MLSFFFWNLVQKLFSLYAILIRIILLIHSHCRLIPSSFQFVLSLKMVSQLVFVLFQMEMMDASMPDVGIMGPVNPEVNANEVEDFGQRVDEMFIKVDKVGLVN